MVTRFIAAGLAATLLVTTFSLFSLSAARAHASLTFSSIKNGQVFHVGHAPTSIKATFAEELNPKKSWMALFEGQADHGLVTERQHSVVNFKNPRQMTLRLPRLGPEKYYLIWYTQSSVDNHYAAGIVYFQVIK